MKKIDQFKIFLLVIIILIFAHFTKILIPLENQLLIFFSSWQQAIYTQTKNTNTLLYFLLNFKKLLNENWELKSQINQQKIEQVELNLLKSENENLKNLLNYFSTHYYQYLTAKVIGRSLLDPQVLILDKGRADGVKKNSAVIYNNGIIVGKINEVKEKISYLLPLTDNQSLIAAKTLNKARTIGLMKGQLGINGLMSLIPQEEAININDFVITSGLEENIPSGLLIGQIIELKSSPQSLFKEAIIKPFFEIGYLDYLTIILTTNE